jgi:hypothetical protein
MGRRKLSDQATGDTIEVLSRPPKKRDRSWESAQRGKGVVVTYRGIPAELQARIKEIAGKHGVPIGELARAFLEYALAAYESGDLELSPVEVVTKATLYPGDL